MPRQLQPCGTEAAYQRHWKHREQPCEACRQAHRAYQNEWNAARIARIRQEARRQQAAGEDRAMVVLTEHRLGRLTLG